MLAICIIANATQTAPVTDVSQGNSSVDILNVYSGAFPNISISIFINNSCARAGGLQMDDFTMTEEGSKVAIDNVFFVGGTNDQSVDFVVVFDDTGSMSNEIEAMKCCVE